MARATDIHPVGDRALIAALPDLESVMAFAAVLRQRDILGIREIVPAARTVFVSAWSRGAIRRIAAEIRRLEFDPGEVFSSGRTIEVDVVYDGADLAAVADAMGSSVEAVIERHTSTTWTAAFGGFAPGFAYLDGGGALSVPRRSSPRTVVPAGSVALAGGFSAVYPRESPGGWQLIGRTDAVMWDPSRSEPALVAPGDRVRFRAAKKLRPPPAISAYTHSSAERRNVISILAPGVQSLIEDGGRPGHASIGVAASGAADRASLARANELVGNPKDAAAIENLFGGLQVRAERDVVIAVTGADVDVLVGEQYEDLNAAFLLRAGEVVRLSQPYSGLRSYVAFRGGIVAAAVLGSRSRDVLAGLGPSPLAPGESFDVGPEPKNSVAPAIDLEPPAATVTVRFVPGPRDSWFADVGKLVEQVWTVTSESNRVGIRLSGVPLTRQRNQELASEAMVRGSIQVPPDGLPVVFGADHPVTGGYPVIGTVVDADNDLLGQLAPGNRIKFVLVSVEL